MANRDDYMISSNGYSRGTHKRLLQDSSSSAQEQAKKCYYRCTYHQDHGPATKHVEQSNSQDPPLFRVIYTNDHTCISTDTSSIQIQQMADASLRKAEMELLPGHEAIKEEEGAIVSSLLGVINGGHDVVATLDVMHAMQGNTTALYSNLSSVVGRSSHEASPSISAVQLPAFDEPTMDFEPLESYWFEPLDFSWFIESARRTG
ncbi:hypothetical protein PR202_gb04389 [Eleusine coracana subsp. coracana]|uniref:WRKY domain-containing protein n=1 Tax=Eleusine coracana subsp. coracana TaxID=191504 RepID=A0AAV5E473_ELECO|nr:hypothetical protein PR202_gb04389 [Eleusine coracana subsp. coracana]